MQHQRQELPLKNPLSAPLGRTAMAADGGDPQELSAMLAAIASTLDHAQSQRSASLCATNCA